MKESHRLWRLACQNGIARTEAQTKFGSGNNAFVQSSCSMPRVVKSQIGTRMEICPNARGLGSYQDMDRHDHLSVCSLSLALPQFQKKRRSGIRYVVLRVHFGCFNAITFLLHMAFVDSGTRKIQKRFTLAYFGLCIVREAQRSTRPNILPIIEPPLSPEVWG